MVTLFLIATFMFALCTAAAVLIASAQNGADAAEVTLGDSMGADLQA